MTNNPLFASQIGNLSFLEQMYQLYIEKNQTLDSSWIDFFKSLEESDVSTDHVYLNDQKPNSDCQQLRIMRLIEMYREFGHQLAHINPLQEQRLIEDDRFDLNKLGFHENEKQQLFPSCGLLNEKEAPLEVILKKLKQHYCGWIGYDLRNVKPHIGDWIYQQVEKGKLQRLCSHQEKLEIFRLLGRTELIEYFLHTKHTGKKRFSIEGCESLIPLLAFFMMDAAEGGVEEVIMGMSHRGRINVLANIFNKSLKEILSDFDEELNPGDLERMGDMHYHKGYDNEINTLNGKKLKLTLTSNPSHLESVDPVVQGQVHAKQFLTGDERERKKIIPLLIHGDAALSGQGIVYESLQLSGLAGYQTGGTLHLVINNQIGFTTSPEEGRSTSYCTDIAQTFGCPVFHINAEQPELCIHLIKFALEIRQRFHCDVFIDLNCYRKYGHNEGDEPTFTHPLEYQIIKKKKSLYLLYKEQLIYEKILREEEAQIMEDEIKTHLQTALNEQKETRLHSISKAVNDLQFTQTNVEEQKLKKLLQAFQDLPPHFSMHPKLEKFLLERSQLVEKRNLVDWGLAEWLAYGTLLIENCSIRLTGQDTRRGTFSHRHAGWIDQKNNQVYLPLAHLHPNQARFEVINSCLSEAGVLGFEYGYSLVAINGLTIWEAQFGDFANSAQVIIDQYIASGEEKWGQKSNIILYLPHGYEGQGPEHSSARLERFLSLAGHDNIQIVNPTTPSQLFHLLRRQIKQAIQKPVVIFTPKSLLRHPFCVSSLSDLTTGKFHSILDDPNILEKKEISEILLCSGKIYYDLKETIEKQQHKTCALVRIEQFYPFDKKLFKSIIESYSSCRMYKWVQEEPENMGAWTWISSLIPSLLPKDSLFFYRGRPRSSTPATGFRARHKKEQEELYQEVFK